MPFTLGQIVRPKLQYARKDGELQDWAGLRSAQALVTMGPNPAVGVPSIPYWDPEESAYVSTFKSENFYAVTVWDIASQSFVPLSTYAESELDPGSVGTAYGGSTPVTATFDVAYGVADERCANLVRSRT